MTDRRHTDPDLLSCFGLVLEQTYTSRLKFYLQFGEAKESHISTFQLFDEHIVKSFGLIELDFERQPQKMFISARGIFSRESRLCALYQV